MGVNFAQIVLDGDEFGANGGFETVDGNALLDVGFAAGALGFVGDFPQFGMENGNVDFVTQILQHLGDARNRFANTTHIGGIFQGGQANFGFHNDFWRDKKHKN